MGSRRIDITCWIRNCVYWRISATYRISFSVYYYDIHLKELGAPQWACVEGKSNETQTEYNFCLQLILFACMSLHTEHNNWWDLSFCVDIQFVQNYVILQPVNRKNLFSICELHSPNFFLLSNLLHFLRVILQISSKKSSLSPHTESISLHAARVDMMTRWNLLFIRRILEIYL